MPEATLDAAVQATVNEPSKLPATVALPPATAPYPDQQAPYCVTLHTLPILLYPPRTRLPQPIYDRIRSSTRNDFNPTQRAARPAFHATTAPALMHVKRLACLCSRLTSDLQAREMERVQVITAPITTLPGMRITYTLARM